MTKSASTFGCHTRSAGCCGQRAGRPQACRPAPCRARGSAHHRAPSPANVPGADAQRPALAATQARGACIVLAGCPLHTCVSPGLSWYQLTVRAVQVHLSQQVRSGVTEPRRPPPELRRAKRRFVSMSGLLWRRGCLRHEGHTRLRCLCEVPSLSSFERKPKKGSVSCSRNAASHTRAVLFP